MYVSRFGFNVLLFNITKCPNVQKESEKFRGVLRSLRSATDRLRGLRDMAHFILDVDDLNLMIYAQKNPPPHPPLLYGSTSRTSGQGQLNFSVDEKK
jgi:hypothetical protein